MVYADHPNEGIAKIAQRLHAYEFPANVHGDRLSLKLTADQAVEAIIFALSDAGYVVKRSHEAEDIEVVKRALLES